MFRTTFEFKVRWADTDAAGIVYFPNFYKWIDHATHDIFTEIGSPAAQLRDEQKIGWPLLETHCEFKTPAYFEDEIRLETQIVEVRDKVFRMTHEFYRGDTLLAHGHTVRAWTSFAQEKPKAVSIPEHIREIFTGSETFAG